MLDLHQTKSNQVLTVTPNPRSTSLGPVLTGDGAERRAVACAGPDEPIREVYDRVKNAWKNWANRTRVLLVMRTIAVSYNKIKSGYDFRLSVFLFFSACTKKVKQEEKNKKMKQKTQVF